MARITVVANDYGYGVFSVAALVPSPPILVPELCGAACETDGPARLRAAALTAVGALAGLREWTAIGVGAADQVLGPDALGTFRGFGADVRAGLSARALGATPDPELPLPALITGWLRGVVAPDATVTVRIIAADTEAARCASIGSALRAELDRAPEPSGVLVLGDGAATLSLKAPGYLDERAAAAQAALDRALAIGDLDALATLDPVLCDELMLSGRAAYQVLAGLFAADVRPPAIETLYQDAPFGVGYDVAVWRPDAEGGAV